MMVASASLVTERRRSWTVSSGTCRPAATHSSSPPASRTHTWRRSGRPTWTWATVLAWSSVSTNAATAPESLRIHSTCSAEDVS